MLQRTNLIPEFQKKRRDITQRQQFLRKCLGEMSLFFACMTESCQHRHLVSDFFAKAKSCSTAFMAAKRAL
ncbi:hypothetical protein BJF95_12240 [Rhizobium oryziradicis]|uniref:Uncharacterized protein n=1 Tax=Rhizobium oryziradicis TaxID=1867956 RepID=A0A1Q8ZY46_9HYPH|nr:hypothetical protein BJF95_12240 [Rhizobium oryziradicis]